MIREWTAKSERLPTEEDADEWGCVLVWHLYNGCQMLGWNNPMLKSSTYITHWMRPPHMPGRDEAKEEHKHDAGDDEQHDA